MADNDETEDTADTGPRPDSDEALDPAEAGPDLDLEVEHDIPHNEDLQDPAGVGTELTHDQFNLGRTSRIN